MSGERRPTPCRSKISMKCKSKKEPPFFESLSVRYIVPIDHGGKLWPKGTISGGPANRLPVEFKNLHADIDWQRIRGFRNRIVHDYFGVDYRIVWLVTKSFLRGLISRLKSLAS